LLLKVLARRPRDWDLFLSYAVWKIREYGRPYRLIAQHLTRRLIRRNDPGKGKHATR